MTETGKMPQEQLVGVQAERLIERTTFLSLLYRRKSAPASSDFQGAFYSVVQPISGGLAFLFADSDRLPSPLRSDF